MERPFASGGHEDVYGNMEHSNERGVEGLDASYGTSEFTEETHGAQDVEESAVASTHSSDATEMTSCLQAVPPMAQVLAIDLSEDLVLSLSLSPAPTQESNAIASPNYFDWNELYPELKILVEGLSEILQECLQVSSWRAWPEKHYDEGCGQDWKVRVLIRICWDLQVKLYLNASAALDDRSFPS